MLDGRGSRPSVVDIGISPKRLCDKPIGKISAPESAGWYRSLFGQTAFANHAFFASPARAVHRIDRHSERQRIPAVGLVLISEWPEIGDPEELSFDRFPDPWEVPIGFSLPSFPDSTSSFLIDSNR